jgi:hypothetical protein
MIEQGIDYPTLLAIVPIVAITINQARAIYRRDDHRCIFPFQHDCHGKLSIHHIDGKEDEAENLATVCREAHWEYLHSEATDEEKLQWKSELTSVVQEKTASRLKIGWVFPDS